MAVMVIGIYQRKKSAREMMVPPISSYHAYYGYYLLRSIAVTVYCYYGDSFYYGDSLLNPLNAFRSVSFWVFRKLSPKWTPKWITVTV